MYLAAAWQSISLSRSYSVLIHWAHYQTLVPSRTWFKFWLPTCRQHSAFWSSVMILSFFGVMIELTQTLCDIHSYLPKARWSASILWPQGGSWASRQALPLEEGHVGWRMTDTADFDAFKKPKPCQLWHGSLNVPIEHHPTIRYMVYNGYYKVMSHIPKMGQLPTPVWDSGRIVVVVGKRRSRWNKLTECLTFFPRICTKSLVRACMGQVAPCARSGNAQTKHEGRLRWTSSFLHFFFG